MRAFVKLRETVAAHKELAHKLEQLEKKIENGEISAIFSAIRLPMAEPDPKQKKIGYIKEASARCRTTRSAR